MKMVKSLLLGSAAGLMAVAGAQAADLPVKAAPVEYVKICSLYGAGFYYLPGTDICVKIGGYVRGQYYVNTGTAPSSMPFFQGPMPTSRPGARRHQRLRHADANHHHNGHASADRLGHGPHLHEHRLHL